MSPDDLFGIASLLALPGWVVLVLAPRRWAVLNAVPAYGIPLALSALYSGLILAYFAQAGGAYDTLSNVRLLFADDMVLVAGWAHYLAFDLMIGSLAAGRMDRVGVGRLVQAPILLSIFMFGPLGWLLAILVETGLRPLRPMPTQSPRLIEA